MNRAVQVGAIATAFSIIVLVACTGDDPVTAAGAGVDGGAETGNGSSGNQVPSCVGDTVEACGATCAKCTAPTGGTVACSNGECVATCPPAQAVCGAACVAVTTTATDCGRCGHDCGAGECKESLCQPFAAVTGVANLRSFATSASGLIVSAGSDVSLCDSPRGCAAVNLKLIQAGVDYLDDMAVAGTEVFFNGSIGDNEIVYRCPITGCPGAGPTVVESVPNDQVIRIVAGGNNVLWTRYQSYYGPYSARCAVPGCTSLTRVRNTGSVDYSANPAREQSTPRMKTVSVGNVWSLWATGSLYNDGAKQLRGCKVASSCTTPTEFNTDSAGVSALTYYDGKHYGASSASGGNVIFSVDDVATPGPRAFLVTDAAGIADVTVDASGIYWINASTKKVLRCSNLAGCQGGGETLAINQSGLTRIRTDEKFVYWTSAAGLMKVAK